MRSEERERVTLNLVGVILVDGLVFVVTSESDSKGTGHCPWCRHTEVGINTPPSRVVS